MRLAAFAPPARMTSSLCPSPRPYSSLAHSPSTLPARDRIRWMYPDCRDNSPSNFVESRRYISMAFASLYTLHMSISLVPFSSPEASRAITIEGWPWGNPESCRTKTRPDKLP
ncbi:hypothetical protein BDW68DRAFT_102316 [Aspergillus falconensis]